MNYNTDITNARKNLFKLIDMVIDDRIVVNISTKNGNAILISEDKYKSLLETLYLSEKQKYKKTLTEGKNNKVEDLVDENVVQW